MATDESSIWKFQHSASIEPCFMVVTALQSLPIILIRSCQSRSIGKFESVNPIYITDRIWAISL